ncbi:MAG TPA: NTP transferase domain-containing protein [Acidimicrobiales bacterium]|nr:NTP transferase domain-containing protein [Acidimicrobiales bacterium]
MSTALPTVPVGVVLAAGEGTRLRPLTTERPKALCPVGGRPLLDLALDRLRPWCARLAVNAHHHVEQMAIAARERDVHLSVERGDALGTAGALGALRHWIDGTSVLLTNADADLGGPPPDLLAGWDGSRIRLAVVPDAEQPDFDGRWRYAGVALMAWADVVVLAAEPTGLYEVSWRQAITEGRVDYVEVDGTFRDCGTPADYLAANMFASDGDNVVGDGAVVRGSIERCVVWDGARVEANERLTDAIRTTGGLTVSATPPIPTLQP